VRILFVLHGKDHFVSSQLAVKLNLFKHLPERSRLLRLTTHYEYLCSELLGDKTFLASWIALHRVIHPIREDDRESKAVPKKGNQTTDGLLEEKLL